MDRERISARTIGRELDVEDKFKQWKLSSPVDRSEAYRWACIHELQAIRELLERAEQAKGKPAKK